MVINTEKAKYQNFYSQDFNEENCYYHGAKELVSMDQTGESSGYLCWACFIYENNTTSSFKEYK